jgi:hypothetical protein
VTIVLVVEAALKAPVVITVVLVPSEKFQLEAAQSFPRAPLWSKMFATLRTKLLRDGKNHGMILKQFANGDTVAASHLIQVVTTRRSLLFAIRFGL